MCATAAHLIEEVLPEVALRRWVLTFPFAWRKRLAMDGRLLSALTRIFVTSVQALYGGALRAMTAPGKTGAVIVVQRTSSDLRLNPHLHVVFLDGGYHDNQGQLVWQPLRQLRTRDVGQVLERAERRMARYLMRRGMLEPNDDAEPDEPHAGQLEASAVCGRTPPAGPQWLRGLRAPEPSALSYDKPLCAALDGFTLHAATKAGAMDTAGREALLRYVLRPPIAQERVVPQKSGLVAITLKRAYADGTVAVEMDPLSLLCRLAMSVPPPRQHIVKYAGVLAAASKLRAKIAPVPVASTDAAESPPKPRRGSYFPWALLMRRTFGLDVLQCPKCRGRLKLLALVVDDHSIARYLKNSGEPSHLPARAPPRGPPFWASTVLRRKALADIDMTASAAFDG